jgi:hypothetical protein
MTANITKKMEKIIQTVLTIIIVGIAAQRDRAVKEVL